MSRTLSPSTHAEAPAGRHHRPHVTNERLRYMRSATRLPSTLHESGQYPYRQQQSRFDVAGFN